MAKITKHLVDRTKPRDRDIFVWDSELKGFGLKVTPTGRKVFVYQHRTRAGVQRRATLGTFGALTPDQARSEAVQIAGRVAAGDDPALEKLEKRVAGRDATIAKLAPAYLDGVSARARPRSAYEYSRIFEKYILPALGDRPVASLTLAQISALHMAHRKRPIMANRIVTALRSFLYWCERRGYRAPGSNLCRNIERFAEISRERFLTVTELALLGAALNQAERDGLPTAPSLRKRPKSDLTAKHRPKTIAPVPANPFAVAAIRFLLISGWRENEALTLRWTDVDFTRTRATLPTSKTGRSERRLGQPAINLLRTIPRVAGSPFVFPGRDVGKPLREIKRVWLAARHAAGLDDVRLHDLRHAFASFAIGSGQSLYVTGKLLGHKQAATTQRYAHLADDAAQAAADEVSTTIWAAMNGTNASIVPLRSTR